MNLNISSGKKFQAAQICYENFEKLKRDEIKGKIILNIGFLFVSLLFEIGIFWFINK